MFCGDLLAYERKMLQFVANSGDPLGARTAKIAVVPQHSAEGLRIFLVQQELQLFLAAIDVGGPQFSRQRPALGRELLLELGFLPLEIP